MSDIVPLTIESFCFFSQKEALSVLFCKKEPKTFRLLRAAKCGAIGRQ
jgi:hypothetical protein